MLDVVAAAAAAVGAQMYCEAEIGSVYLLKGAIGRALLVMMPLLGLQPEMLQTVTWTVLLQKARLKSKIGTSWAEMLQCHLNSGIDSSSELVACYLGVVAAPMPSVALHSEKEEEERLLISLEQLS